MAVVISRNEHDALYNYFNYRLVRRRQGSIMVVTGNPITQMGNGKTTAACAIGQYLDKKFTIEKVCFRLSPFLEQVDQIREETSRGRGFGQVCILDEGQAAIPSDEWFTASSKALFEVATVFRKARALAIVITPNFNFIMKKIRHVVNYWGIPDIQGHDSDLTSHIKIYKLNHDLFSDNFHIHRIKVWNEPTQRVTLINKFIVKPDKSFMKLVDNKEDYEKALIHKSAMAAAAKYEKSLEPPDVKSFTDKARELANLPEINLYFKEKGRITSQLVNYLQPTLGRSDAAHIAGILTIIKKSEAKPNGIKPTAPTLGLQVQGNQP